MARPERTEHEVHQSLVKTPLYAGVDRGFLLFEVATVGSLFFLVGFHLATVGLAVLWVAVLHPVMAWINNKDPLLAQLYVRSLTAKDFYLPHAKHYAAGTKTKPSIPRR